ncbi:MAG TPA: 2-C-methyl-D-erythritol 4-phosphate cytidylyltransferase [Candidatus Polarisedimenticolia bacterium]|nr:2-C-methyl-D-erythritol 4-phosphate cytidylyltransferase [Candidatus Polarisedimenticolia bacterium]
MPRPAAERRPRDTMTIVALIVAAGRGTRLGASRPKPFVPLAGVPILARAVAPFAAHPRITRIVIVSADPAAAATLLGEAPRRFVFTLGGDRRQDSVRRGLQAMGEADLVLVHDAARPLVSRRIIDRVIEAALVEGAAVPAIAVVDTVKRRAPDGTVVATLSRDDLRLAQTPQGFRADLLRSAYARAEQERFPGTDDASLVERAGGRVMLVEGSPRNLKITTSADLVLAEALLAAWEEDGDGAATS